MSDYRKPNFLPAFLLLFTLLLLITSSQLSLTSNVYGKSDNASDKARGQDNGNNGKDDDGGSGDDDDGGSGDDGSDGGDGGGSDDDGSENNVQSDTTDGEPKKNNEQTLVSQGDNQTVQVGNQIAQDKYKGKVFYILIKSANNQTDFVPDKVTLSEGSKVVWLNSDNSGHRITVGSESKSDYALLNSLILPNGMVDQEFKSAGTYSYSDLDSPQSHGIITILDKTEKNAAISESPND